MGDMGDKANAEVVSSGCLETRNISEERCRAEGFYKVECIRDGEVLWEDEIVNLVVDAGKNSMLDKYLGLGAAHSAIHMGLKQAGSPAAGDTMASHAGWSEGTVISARQVPSFNAAASGSKATSSAVGFAINGSQTIAGVFIVMSGNSTVSNTTGTLHSAGDFSGGSRAVINGDTLNVTYTHTL